MKIIFLLSLFIGTTFQLSQAQSDSLLINQIPVLHSALERIEQRIVEINELQALHNQRFENQADSLELLVSRIEDLTSATNEIAGLISRQQSLVQQQQQQQRDITQLTNQTNLLGNRADSLQTLLTQTQNNMASLADDLGIQIEETGKQAETRILELGSDVEKNRLYWIIATLVILLLGGLMFLFLGKRIKSSHTDIETQIRNTKKSLEEEGLRLDAKLIQVLETQLKVQQEETKRQPDEPAEKIDHSLALKVADEIVRMQKNISRMDAGIKGLKPLEKGIERIQANFAANGYEMVNLMNNEYDERMNIDVINFVEDASLEAGKKVISKIIKPQVNFNGILIQRAQVEVSQN
ncbi:MAG: hypothetical protein LAT75_12970 [Candidatus Cyclonatronum sp.]|uniref:hypothetical protein n=1 Tax=Cyclonatronum sp. TaxID=3024185 RepID=UPI0025C0FEC9|nr:hypothetical protein [Cyclonatronum sp.]MCH8487774.1 hypothetical protein [Cyclonatronum sp.]